MYLDLGGIMPVIGSTLMWAENPAEWQESGSKMYVNASSSLLIMYTLSVAWCPEKDYKILNVNKSDSTFLSSS